MMKKAKPVKAPKANTLIQQNIRQKKKEEGVVTVTLELKKEEYALLQKMSKFLVQGDIEPGQKKVIKTYTNIFNYLLNTYNKKIPKDTTTKKFYRHCAIAKFYKQTSGSNDNEIVAELNKLKVKANDKLIKLRPPQYILSTDNKEEYEKWNLDNFKESLDPDFLVKGIKKIKSNKKKAS